MKRNIMTLLLLLFAVPTILAGCKESQESVDVTDSGSEVSQIENDIDDEADDNDKEEVVDDGELTGVDESDELNISVANAKVWDDSMFDQYATEDWQFAYRDVLKENLKDIDDPDFAYYSMQKYAIYDIDKNDVPELLYFYGTCEADYTIDVYYFDGNKAVTNEHVGAGHSVFYTYPDGNGFIRHMAHMGYAEGDIIRFDLAGGLMSAKEIFEDDLNSRQKDDPDAWYYPVTDFVPNAKHIEFNFLINTYGLIEYVNPVLVGNTKDLSHDDFEKHIDKILSCEEDFYAVNGQPVFFTDAVRFNGEKNMSALYEKDGIFRGFDGEVSVKETYYNDFNDDGYEECLVVVEEDENQYKAMVLFSCQNDAIYGYVSDVFYHGDVKVTDDRIYVSEWDSGYGEVEFSFCLDQCDIRGKASRPSS